LSGEKDTKIPPTDKYRRKKQGSARDSTLETKIKCANHLERRISETENQLGGIKNYILLGKRIQNQEVEASESWSFSCLAAALRGRVCRGSRRRKDKETFKGEKGWQKTPSNVK